MKLLAALALVIALGTSAYGIKCYLCIAKYSCTTTVCGSIENRCFTKDANGVVTRGCRQSQYCDSTVKCCVGDFCNANPTTTTPKTTTPKTTTRKNSAPLTLPPVLLLGLTAFITLYLNQD